MMAITVMQRTTAKISRKYLNQVCVEMAKQGELFSCLEFILDNNVNLSRKTLNYLWGMLHPKHSKLLNEKEVWELSKMLWLHTKLPQASFGHVLEVGKQQGNKYLLLNLLYSIENYPISARNSLYALVFDAFTNLNLDCSSTLYKYWLLNPTLNTDPRSFIWLPRWLKSKPSFEKHFVQFMTSLARVGEFPEGFAGELERLRERLGVSGSVGGLKGVVQELNSDLSLNRVKN